MPFDLRFVLRYALIGVVAAVDRAKASGLRAPTRSSPRTWMSCRVCSILKSFEYVLQPLVHAQICCFVSR
jgi:hypothetical protein